MITRAKHDFGFCNQGQIDLEKKLKVYSHILLLLFHNSDFLIRHVHAKFKFAKCQELKVLDLRHFIIK
jgi:hypothetical protein